MLLYDVRLILTVCHVNICFSCQNFILNKYTNLGAGCSPNCMNNGTCGSDNVCQCSSGYNGSYCQTPICSQACVNGNCSSPNTCTCNSGWNGSTCNSGNLFSLKYFSFVNNLIIYIISYLFDTLSK